MGIYFCRDFIHILYLSFFRSHTIVHGINQCIDSRIRAKHSMLFTLYAIYLCNVQNVGKSNLVTLSFIVFISLTRWIKRTTHTHTHTHRKRKLQVSRCGWRTCTLYTSDRASIHMNHPFMRFSWFFFHPYYRTVYLSDLIALFHTTTCYFSFICLCMDQSYFPFASPIHHISYLPITHKFKCISHLFAKYTVRKTHTIYSEFMSKRFLSTINSKILCKYVQEIFVPTTQAMYANLLHYKCFTLI